MDNPMDFRPFLPGLRHFKMHSFKVWEEATRWSSIDAAKKLLEDAGQR